MLTSTVLASFYLKWYLYGILAYLLYSSIFSTLRQRFWDHALFRMTLEYIASVFNMYLHFLKPIQHCLKGAETDLKSKKSLKIEKKYGKYANMPKKYHLMQKITNTMEVSNIRSMVYLFRWIKIKLSMKWAPVEASRTKLTFHII